MAISIPNLQILIERVYKLSSWGLWSLDRGFARPLMPSTPRESPAFACEIYLVNLSTLPLLLARRTYDIDFVSGNQGNASGTARNFFLVLGVCKQRRTRRVSMRFSFFREGCLLWHMHQRSGRNGRSPYLFFVSLLLLLRAYALRTSWQIYIKWGY